MEISPDRPAGSRLLTLARRWFRGKLERGPAMSKRLVTVVSVLALGTLALSARAQTIRISYSGTSGQNLPFWLTYDAGLFKKYGLPVELVLVSGGLTNMQAMLANEIRFSYLGGASPISSFSPPVTA